MDNLGWGLQMTVLGMGLVFLLLALLWGLLTLVLTLDKTPAPKPEPPSAAPMDATQTALPADLIAVIAVAALKHRSALRHEAARLGWRASSNEEASGSRWVVTGRARQNASWQPRGK